MHDRDGIERERSDDQPLIRVWMEDEQVIMRPTGRIDRDAVETLVGALAACDEAGVTAVIDLDAPDGGPSHRWDDDVPGASGRLRVPVRAASPPSAVAPSGPEIPGPAFIRLASSSAWWTVDLRGRRLCRTSVRLDPRFVATGSWVAVRRLAVSPSALEATMADGSLICCSRSGVGAAVAS